MDPQEYGKGFLKVWVQEVCLFEVWVFNGTEGLNALTAEIDQTFTDPQSRMLLNLSKEEAKVFP